MILETLLSGIGGGILRLLPEALSFFDRKNERKHELDMLSAEMQYATLKGEQEMRRTEAAISVSELDAITQAVREQGETARSAGWFVAALSALVRPLITYWFTALYTGAKLAGMWIAVDQGADWKDVLFSTWTEDDMQIYSMILVFWFMGRTIDKKK